MLQMFRFPFLLLPVVLKDICTRTDGCELSEEEEFALEVTSIVGTALSLFGIVLTIVTLVGFK